jgi:phospholipid/cholesterol/gamma-HCH transport system substrate-binding protein
MSSEIKVGVIFFLGVAILLIMTIVVTGFSFFEHGYTFPVYFKNVAGLEEGGRVLFSGVNVGTVDKVTIKDNLVCVLIRVKDKDVSIPADSEVNIEQSSLLAGMQVSITAGTSTRPIQEVKRKLGTEPAGFTQALADAASSAKKAIDDIRKPLTETIANLENITRGISEGDGTAHKLIYEEEIYDNVRIATEKLSNILTELDEGKGTVGALLEDETVYEKLKSTLEEAQKAVSGIREIVEAVQKGEGTLGKFIKDDEVYENVREITRDIKDVTATVKKGLEGESILAKLFSNESVELYDDLKDTTAGAKQLLDRLNSGEGTLGKLFTSEELYDDLKAITGNLRITTDKLNTKDSTIGKLFNESTLYDKAVKTIDDFDVTLGAAARTKVFVHLNFFTSNHPFQEYRGQVHIKLWPHERRYFLLGATFTDVGEAAPLIQVDPDYRHKGKYLANPDFQLAWVFNLGSSDEENEEQKEDAYSLTLRVGLIDGLTGGGFDLDFWRHFRLTCEVRTRHRSPGSFYEDISPFYGRAYLSMRLFKYFRVYAGADNFADQAVLSFGVSIEWEDKDIKSIVGIAGAAY